MSYADWEATFQKFQQIESENDYFNIELKDVRYWHLIRFELYQYILQQKFHMDKGHTEKYSTWKTIFTFIPKLGRVFSNYPFKNPGSYDFLWVPHPRRKKNGQYFIDIYSDYFYPLLPGNTLILERLYEHKHLEPVPEKNIIWFDIDELLRIFSSVKRIFFPLKKSEKKQLLEQITALESGLNVKINPKFYFNIVYKQISNYSLLKPYFYHLLKKIRPKAVFEVIGYALPNMVMNEQATRLGIPTIEIQHGIIGKHSVAYNFNNVPESAFFPDYFATFGEFWNRIASFAFLKENIFKIGFPYLTENAERYKSTPETNKVLIISQGTTSKVLIEFISKYHQTFKDSKTKFIYKLHPSEYGIWRKHYPELPRMDVEVIDHDHVSLYQLIAESAKVIGVYSTALIEAMYFKMPVGVIKTDGYQYMQDFIKKGYATVIETPENLREMLIQKNDHNKSESILCYQWKHNFINLLRQLNIN